jgi:hypothetical protein
MQPIALPSTVSLTCSPGICRNLKSIVVQIGIADYFKEPSSPEAQKLFEDMVTKLQVRGAFLRPHKTPWLGLLKVAAVYLPNLMRANLGPLSAGPASEAWLLEDSAHQGRRWLLTRVRGGRAPASPTPSALWTSGEALAWTRPLEA